MAAEGQQLLLYARDLRHLLEIERGQRVLLQDAYNETVAALASALESKDTGTRAHSQRVQRYALELARSVSPDLVDDPSAEYGFLLHDVGKIGIPDRILQKPRAAERRRDSGSCGRTPCSASRCSAASPSCRARGSGIVRSHHERWDGDGYPDGLAGTDIPLAARIFAVADSLDAMTSDRPYRPALTWADAGREIVGESRSQFDPAVVKAFVDREDRLLAIRSSWRRSDVTRSGCSPSARAMPELMRRAAIVSPPRWRAPPWRRSAAPAPTGSGRRSSSTSPTRRSPRSRPSASRAA